MARVNPRAERAWKRLVSWYGARMADQYGPTCPADWATAIERVDDERLEKALIEIRRISPAHPPTLGQFESAIPKREIQRGPNLAEQLVEFVIARRRTCEHQRADRWNFFGPVAEHTNERRTVTHPSIKGVQVPACEKCQMPTVRVLLDEILYSGVSAA